MKCRNKTELCTYALSYSFIVHKSNFPKELVYLFFFICKSSNILTIHNTLRPRLYYMPYKLNVLQLPRDQNSVVTVPLSLFLRYDFNVSIVYVTNPGYGFSHVICPLIFIIT